MSLDLMSINEREMLEAIDKVFANNGKAVIEVFCAIYGNHEDAINSDNIDDVKVFAFECTRNNHGLHDVYLS